MNENDPYFYAYDQALWYALGRNEECDHVPVTPECFAKEYANDARLYNENKPNAFDTIPNYFANYLKSFECFDEIVRSG